ncbi:NUDIX domain-containing protein [Paenibacillus thiaminolyticus]|uniref:NUDIX hydrolase n=1 Tax=Paenibacillus thiaminolyticus TaxID=49283 RepID=UPI00232F6A2F|nr:NUDIX domain-containing protein [Paenibacillus thiaminolyticus]WCF10664.1 NUDIX domain-containing protein [Paenibacillus thiaminolyticus]
MKIEHNEVSIQCTGIAVVLLKKSNDEFKVLLLKRAAPPLKDEWCYIGGSIEAGEKAWEAALREIEEETGITKISLYITNKFDQFYSKTGNYIYIAPVFVGYVEGEQDVVLNEEHTAYKWLFFQEAKEIALPGNDEVLGFIEKHFARKTPSKWLHIWGGDGCCINELMLHAH